MLCCFTFREMLNSVFCLTDLNSNQNFVYKSFYDYSKPIRIYYLFTYPQNDKMEKFQTQNDKSTSCFIQSSFPPEQCL